jgi:acetyltransferase-like isoleucine patch superfamily enzyme
MRDTYIDSTALVHPDAKIGKGTHIWNWTKVREGSYIGKNCNIGQGVYIDFGAIIGDNCKVQNGVSVYNGVKLSNWVFVGPHVVFSNDRFPRAHTIEWEPVPTIIEEGASIGSNATIVCGVTLGRNCMIGAGALVTKDVPPHALVIGHPARIIDYIKTSGERLYHDLDKPAPSDEVLNDMPNR